MTRNLPPASPANSAVMFVAFVIGTAGARNIEPSGWIVHTGSCRSAFLPGAPLAFTARTIPANVSVASWHWNVSLAPASAKVTFSSPNSPTTTAAFSSEGVYRLSATADGRVGTLVVEVYDTRLGTHDGTPRNFSYHLDTLQKVFTGDANLPIDPVAVAALKANPSITAVPAVGVHPRVLFSPGDLPDIRHRLATTGPGRAVFTQIRDRVSGTAPLLCLHRHTDTPASGQAPLRPVPEWPRVLQWMSPVITIKLKQSPTHMYGRHCRSCGRSRAERTLLGGSTPWLTARGKAGPAPILKA